MRIIDQEWIDRAEERGGNSGRGVKVFFAQAIEQSDEDNARERGETAEGKLRLAGEHDPRFEGEVISRRVNIGGGRLEDGGEVFLRHGARVAFVVPVTLIFDAVEAQPGGEEEGEEKGGEAEQGSGGAGEHGEEL